MTEPLRVAIVGGGFAGLAAARELARERVSITLVDRTNHYLFQPLLYQVATAELNPSDIASPIRWILRGQRNVEVRLDEALRVDVARRALVLRGGELPYDRLIVASGMTHSYFGHDDWAAAAPGLKDLADALEIRRRLFTAFERAESAEDLREREEWLTFAIVGAGPTGVELAGALAEIRRESLRGNFRRIDPTRARIVLVEGLDRPLAAFPEALSENARKKLARLGVEIRTGARVTAIDARGVSIGEERLPARTVIWTAGVAGSPLSASLGAPLDRAGRVLVTRELTVPGRDDVFVVGDLASLEQDGAAVFGTAPAAMQAGRHAGRQIARQLRGHPLAPFRYRNKGIFAVIGRGVAVGVIGRKGPRVTGRLAWVAWIFIHIYYLIGFRNRLFVLMNWAFSYATRHRGIRLIGTTRPLS